MTAGLPEAYSFDFGVGQSATLKVLGGANCTLAAYDLLNEAGLGLKRLPHIGPERTFGDVAVNLNLRIKIALPENSPLALLDVT
jgi:hypothetical protein